MLFLFHEEKKVKRFTHLLERAVSFFFFFCQGQYSFKDIDVIYKIHNQTANLEEQAKAAHHVW